MPVIAVINRKGGSGKSTLSTHLAAWLASQNLAVMLGDVDRQQSTRAWLKRRSAALPSILPWAMDQKNVLKVPPGVTHVVLDTPGGLHGFELAKVIMSADVVLIPVCNSLFDRESVEACLAELRTLPRVADGRCKLGFVGMRIDARTRAGESLKAWAEPLNVPFLGVLRETQLYVKCLDNGETIFDQPRASTVNDLRQWASILDWLGPIVRPAPAAQVTPSTVPSTPRDSSATHRISGIQTSRPPSLMPAQEALVHGSRLLASGSRVTTPLHSDGPGLMSAHTRNLQTGYTGPQFLLHQKSPA